MSLDFTDPLEFLSNVPTDWTAGSEEFISFDDYSSQSSKPTLLNQDFNLNSPLIPDNTQCGINYLQGEELDSRFADQKADLDLIKKSLRIIRYDTRNLLPTFLQHQTIPKLLYDTRDSIVKPDITGRWRDIWNLTLEPVKASFKNLYNSTVDPVDYIGRFNLLSSDLPEFKKIGQELNVFYETHFITYILNETQQCPKERWVNKVLRSIYAKELIECKGVTVLGKTKYQPIWVVSSRFVLHVPTHCFMDKNFVLMIKDIAVARALSQLSLMFRYDIKDKGPVALVLRNLYDEGDCLLEKFGNRAYDAIKLLEARCTERWNALGHSYRPLIPLSTTLSEHLQEVVDNCPEMKPLTLNFFNVVDKENDPWVVGQLYGAFRHWGHPYIDYLSGLKELEGRVNTQLKVDKAYARKMASDLVYLVLEDQFRKQKKWFATSKGLPPKSELAICIREGVWPTAKVIEDFGDKWDTLELIPCFNVPDTIDMTDLFSDKAHSMQRSDIINHIQENKHTPIPARRVMSTLLETETINIPEFLKSINDKGLTNDDLVIGLKAKERELKISGRFFALMSWKMRLYFVITEYLIKKHFVPLFSGLTVADDMTTIVKKLLSATECQGIDSYDTIGIANSLDYSKWNNMQRKDSNSPVFDVMGKFLGFPNLITYTHSIFESSLIYYNDRPDLMTVFNTQVVNKDPNMVVCWNGQLGGLEGLRQKGWTIVNYIVLRREALTRNTRTKFLAQGDNQIVVTEYTLTSKNTQETLEREIINVWRNNQAIMGRIRVATGSLGLTINQDEVVTSAELLIYGKVPIFRGKIIPLETKRWARVNCVTNDQVPTYANSISGCVTGALTVCQFSESPIEVCHQYQFFGTFVAAVISFVNPVLGYDPIRYKRLTLKGRKLFFNRLLYKDPSVGGVCGTNLFRFLLSRFPDPVTESLSWWRTVYYNTLDSDIKELAQECGNPRLALPTLETKVKLLENPTALNIPGGLSSNTIIKEKVLEKLKRKTEDGTIKNQVIREAVSYTELQRQKFVHWLFTIRPIFPRFLSEFYTSTYFRITEGVVSIFENSRTIRKLFSRDFSSEILQVIVQGEAISIKSLLQYIPGPVGSSIWGCSATRADQLRRASWGPELTGITVPHPGEFLQEKLCTLNCSGQHIVAKKVVESRRQEWTKGKLTPYLGSKTRESTSIIQPWEKNIEIPLLRRASDLRKAIGWFVAPGSKLGLSIYNNLTSLSGLDFKEDLESFQRTGSSKHRLHCSRVSSEGNPGISFNNLSYVTVTTDTLGELNESNHDFMYQSLICWAGILSTLPGNTFGNQETTHFHIRDLECIRELREETLEVPTEYKFLDKSTSVRKMLTMDIKLIETPRFFEPDQCDWDQLSGEDKSWHLGRAQGFLWGLHVFSHSVREAEGTLFPTSITRKVFPFDYMDGLHRGFCLGATLTPMYTRYGSLSEKARLKFEGSFWNLIERALAQSNLPHIVNHKQFSPFLVRMGGDVIKHYPARRSELTDVVRRYFLRRLISDRSINRIWHPIPVIGFADMNTEYLLGVFRVAENVLRAFQYDRVSERHMKLLANSNKQLKLLSSLHHGTNTETDNVRLQKWVTGTYLPRCTVVGAEARHAVSSIIREESSDIFAELTDHNYEEGEGIGCQSVIAEYQPQGVTPYKESIVHRLSLKHSHVPLFGGIRTIQVSTGAHYKYKDLDKVLHFKGDGIFCGDGSGGFGANHLRKYKTSKVIFNSKLELEGDSYQGLIPAGPGAYLLSGEEVTARCVNYKTCWEDPTDLSNQTTFLNFQRIKAKFKLKIGVICCDAQSTSAETTKNIEDNLLAFGPNLLDHRNGWLVYKTYWKNLILERSYANRVGFYFEKVLFLCPSTQGTFTSEVYIAASQQKSIKTPAPTELTTETLLQVFNIIKANQSPESEFSRAKAFTYDRSILGLQYRVPYQNVEEVAILLTSVGVDTGLALSIAKDLANQAQTRMHPLILIYITLYLVSRRVISVTSWVRPPIKMPSSIKLQKFIATLYGGWYALALLTNDLQAFTRLNELYKGEIEFSVGTTDGKFKRKTNRVEHFLTWKLGPGSTSKHIDVAPRQGLTQQVIRMFWCIYRGRRVSQLITSEDVKRGNTTLLKYDTSMTLKKVCERTGIPITSLGVSVRTATDLCVEYDLG